MRVFDLVNVAGQTSHSNGSSSRLFRLHYHRQALLVLNMQHLTNNNLIMLNTIVTIAGPTSHMNGWLYTLVCLLPTVVSRM